ncbi:hypothetical protein L6164_035658 [Bauhinia variegata]|uniref:Uncharacterized protein n=1 Tax=Bauhinia variegata TaxID=167791 RepID=A0ACB9KES3_BAUVA|nr:hypothetical protein L6164_035658 [Bauhinia variegata]
MFLKKIIQKVTRCSVALECLNQISLKILVKILALKLGLNYEILLSFQEVTGIENFNIVVDGLVVDSELTKYVRTKYDELCYSQRSFLHDHRLEGLNCKLAAGIISETINIADASKITTSPDSFAIWDRTIKAFEAMGMNVSFLRGRLDQLKNLAMKSKRNREARLERDHAEEEKKSLEACGS